MPNVGYATLQIIPSVRGISSELRQQLTAPAQRAGQQAGEEAGGGFSDRFKDMLGALSLAEIGSKLGEEFAETWNQAIEQSNVAGRLKAQLGATGSDAAKYGKVAGSLFAKGIVEDVETGAETVRSVVQGGLVPPGATLKQLRTISTEMSDVATTFGSDMGLQTQAVSALLKNGLAPSAESALDTITYGLQTLGPNAEDLLETFQEYPVQLKKLGLDARTSLGLFSQGLQGGARDTDIVADALKEFSIRSIDMSATSQAAYKSLGLNAKDMSLQIAKGGKGASDGLQLVLDKLRGIKDPVKEQAAAVGLFGTQAEELGSSLLKLDPSKATSALGKVSGSAKQLGKDLRSGPAYEVTQFVRTLRQAFINILGGQVLPVLGRVGGVLNRTVLPPLTAVATVVGGTVLSALKGLFTVGAGVVNWLKSMGTWLIPIGIAVAGFTAAILAQQIATAAVTAVFSVYRGAILAWTLVQRGATIAQAAFNAVMNANPVILVITAIVALAAAVVVAYQRVGWFRAAVQAAWSGIQAGALFLWNNVLKPTFQGIWTGLQTIGQWATWLWSNVLSPVFSFISAAARILLTVLVTLVLLPIVAAFKLLGAIASWLWTTALQPAFQGIAAAAMWLWTNAISPVVGWIVAAFKLWWASISLVFGWFKAGIKAVASAATWLWNNAIHPVINWIVAGFKAWWNGIKSTFTATINFVRGTLGPVFSWLYNSIIKPVWNGIKSAISTVYNSGIKPVFNALKTAVGLVGKAFNAAKDAIKTAWDKIQGIARKPVQYVVDVVYNSGIRGVWNKVADAFGAPKLSKYKFARGGPVYGAGTETSDDVPAWLSKNEHVWTAKEVRGAGGHGAVMAMRKWAAAGGNGAAPGFKDGGGLFGWIGSATSTVKGWGSDSWTAIKKGAKWLKDTLAASARAGVKAVVNPLLDRIPGLDTGWGKAIKALPQKAVDAIFGYADKADEKGASSSFGGGKIPTGQHAAVIQAALRAAGVPPPGTIGQWLSGMNTLIGRESGWNASAINRWDSNAKAGHPSQGLTQTIPGTWSAYVPSSLRGRGILDPVGNVAASIRYIVSRYGNITRVQQADASKPPKGYASGTRGAARGWAWVGEAGPELVNFGGGETVLNNQDSLRTALAMGAVHGYAKGTTAAARKSARGDLPGDLSAWTKALSGSASDIKTAAAALVKDLKTVGGAGTKLAKNTSSAATKLESLANKSATLASTLATAKQFASDQKKSAADYTALSQVTDAASVKDLITGLSVRVADEKATQKQITSLSKRGASKALLSQLIGLGPGSDVTALVSQASTADLKTLNSLVKSGTSLSTSYGNTMADLMYDAGSQAGKGFLTGLQAQEKALDAQMAKLGATLVSSIKKKLKIHSPSRETRWVGQMTGAGVEVGLDDATTQVAAAAARVADAAVPAVPAVSPTGIARSAQAAAAGGLAAGQSVTLVVRDGPTLHAYVAGVADGRVDAGLTEVRRSLSNRR